MPHGRPGARLRAGAVGEAQRFGLDRDRAATVVGTRYRPPQSTCTGLESPSPGAAQRAGAACGTAVLPAECARRACGHPGNRVLVTTPVHLRALPPRTRIGAAQAHHLRHRADCRRSWRRRPRRTMRAAATRIYGFTEGEWLLPTHGAGPDGTACRICNCASRGTRCCKGGHVESKYRLARRDECAAGNIRVARTQRGPGQCRRKT